MRVDQSDLEAYKQNTRGAVATHPIPPAGLMPPVVPITYGSAKREQAVVQSPTRKASGQSLVITEQDMSLDIPRYLWSAACQMNAPFVLMQGVWIV